MIRGEVDRNGGHPKEAVICHVARSLSWFFDLGHSHFTWHSVAYLDQNFGGGSEIFKKQTLTRITGKQEFFD